MSPANPRVLHFNDCANVANFLVRAAARAGLQWDYLPPDQVRPGRNPSGLGRTAWLPYLVRRAARVRRAQVVHVHYATSVPLIHQFPVPPRPYFLHLHGTDIRRLWKDPQWHPVVQRAIDQAEKVFYTNLDTVDEALQARPDAIYMPAFVEPELLPAWRGGRVEGGRVEGSRVAFGGGRVEDGRVAFGGRHIESGKAVFVSRWDADKGFEQQLELVRALRSRFPHCVFEGLDWGPGAAQAARLGVALRPKMPHPQFVKWIAGADVAIGQANRILAISEFEAMYIGLPLVALGSRLPRPEDNSVPPVIEGGVDDILDRFGQVLADPRGASAQLGGHDWVSRHHLADPYIPQLNDYYRAALAH